MARLIKLSDIKIGPKRQRIGRPETDHNELFTSISEGEAGLIHAPLLWKDGEDYWLVAGHGRLTAISEMFDLGIPLRYEGETLPEGMVPYTLIAEISAVGRFEAEFDENVRRTALTVAERASATAELLELKKMKAERDGLPAPTVADLAVELRGSSIGSYQETTRRELIVARHLDNPEVAKAKSLDEAFKVVKRQENLRRAEKMAKEMGPSARTSYVELVNADAREWLATCEPARFGVVLTDPPYGMGADGFGEYEAAGDHRYDDSPDSWRALMGEILPELSRVCKPDAHMYLFCDFDRFHELKEMCLAEGWTVHRTPLIWNNPTGFRTPWPRHGPQRKYELILYARRGEKECLKVYPDLVTYAKDKESIHQAQKPVALLRDLLARSAMPNDEVLDFCCGSAATGVACHEVKLACVCIEKDPAAYGAALQRIQQLAKAA